MVFSSRRIPVSRVRRKESSSSLIIFGNQFLLCIQFGISGAHVLDEYGEELVHECLLLSEERVTVAHGTAEDTTDDVTCLALLGSCPSVMEKAMVQMCRQLHAWRCPTSHLRHTSCLPCLRWLSVSVGIRRCRSWRSFLAVCAPVARSPCRCR